MLGLSASGRELRRVDGGDEAHLRQAGLRLRG